VLERGGALGVTEPAVPEANESPHYVHATVSRWLPC